jgi:DNA-binding SARP family transcriptional activator
VTGQLKIYTLGGSRFLLDGDDFRQFSTRKVEALAIFLASSRRPQPREVLADLLWDDRSQTRALSNLRVALTNLRKHLGSYFTITRDTAALNPEADVWLDVAELESVLAEGQASGDESTRDGLAQIEAAVALYQGEFLQGFSVRKSRHFEEWVTVERERLHYLVTAGLSQAVEGHLARGDYAAGIRQATRWLQLDPLNEAGYRGLMRLLAYDGQVGAALRQYQACVQVLDDEMGLLPSPETVELYEAIQSQQLTPPEKTTIVVTIEEELRPKPGEPPFKGLAYYDVDDAPLFFGREALIARLAGRLAHDRFLAVVGASGSGKSSLVRAGLLPALRNGQPLADGLSRPRGSEMWPVYLITPTARPLKALALSLTRGAASARATTLLMDDLAREPRSLDICVEKLLTESPAQRLLLVVDQFEELFTQCRDEEKRRAFVDNLLNAAMGNPDGPTSVVVTLRADFYAQCARYDRLRELLETQQLYIGQMTDGELRRAIEGPAAAAGWTFEPGLVDLLLHDAGAGRNRKPEPGALPLLSHALLETWRRRRGREMTFAGYAETGGVRGAIARTAEAVFNEELTAEQQPIARSIFLRLTELGEGAQDTRRRATLAELIPRSEDAPAVEAVLKTLADARLVTTGEEGVEVAHEALIREWPRLGEWLAEDREGLRLHRHLTEAAQGWEALQRDEGALYRGARLAQAGEWAQSHGDELNPLERNFLEASQELARREEAEREAQRQRELEAARTLAAAEKRRAEEQARASEQLRKGRRTLVGALVVASVLAVVAIFLGFRFRQSAAEAALQSRLAQARELASYSLEVLEADPQLNLLLAIEAVNRTLPSDGFVTSEAEVALYRALAGRELGVLSGHTGAIYAVTFSPDDGRIVTAGEDGLARVWDSAGNLITTLEGHTGTVTTATFSPDGAYILTGSDDGTARLWDAEGSLITVVEANDFVNSASFSPDGQRIVTGGVNAQLWDTAGNLVATLGGHTKRVHSVVFSPKGKRIVTEMEDGRARLWDSGGNFIAALEGNDIAYSRHVSPVQRRNAANFSPDGERIVTGSAEGTALLWDADGNLITKLEGHRDRIWAASFSPSGTQIVTASEDGTARLWEANGEFIAALEGHAGRVWSAVFSPEGTRIATGSTDGTARLWDDAGNLIATYALHTDIVWPREALTARRDCGMRRDS